MTWASLLIALVKFLGSLADYLHDRQLMTAGEATLIADALEAQANEVDKGRAARLARRAGDTGGMPDDDGDPFRRD